MSATTVTAPIETTPADDMSTRPGACSTTPG